LIRNGDIFRADDLVRLGYFNGRSAKGGSAPSGKSTQLPLMGSDTRNRRPNPINYD
jgi:hypothetical protein